jgi:hypothetical protein
MLELDHSEFTSHIAYVTKLIIYYYWRVAQKVLFLAVLEFYLTERKMF